MSLTRIGSIGINTGIKFSGLTTITTLNSSIDTLSIGGPVSIAGTLTYEDVTNIDAVGLITARNGIVVGSGITLSKDGDIFATGITTVSGNVKVGTGITLSPDGDVFATGVVTATSYYGDGSNLSNVTSTTINTNADNRLITGSGTANTLNGEANFTFDGTRFILGASGNSWNTITRGDLTHYSGIQLNDSGATRAYLGVSGANGHILSSSVQHDVVLRSESDLLFGAGGNAERLRIDSNGMIGFGGVTPKTQNTFDAIEFGKTGFLGSQTGARTVEMASNAYYNSGWKYKEADVASQYYQYQGYHAFTSAVSGSADGAISFVENLRITSGGDLSINSSGLSSPYTSAFRHFSINNNLILNAQNSAGGFAGMQNNAYLNSSGQWVRVNDDHATSIGTDDGVFYFRNAGAGTGAISWNQRLNILANGNVGINVTDPDQRLEVDGIIKGSSYIQTGASGTNTNNFHFGAEGDGTFRLYWKNYGAGNERLRITPSGAPVLRFGATTATDIYNTTGTGNEGAWLVAGGASQFAGSNTVICRMNRKSTNGKILAFYYNGSEVGTIQTNSNSLPSDRNFKTNISDLNLGLSLVNKLKPSQFNFKVDEPNTPVMYGLIAQELEESLISEGVTKNSTQLIQHNPTDNDKESDYDVDYLKLTPVLINAIKELSAEVEQLKSQLNN